MCVSMSCSDADNVENLQEIVVWPSSEENVIEVSEDSIRISFSIINEVGSPSTSFQYGENMLFRLSIENKTDKMMISRDFKGYNDISWDDNFFRVFTAEGKDMGAPWNGMFVDKVDWDSWGFAEQVSCPWSYQNLDNLVETTWSKYSPLLFFPLEKWELPDSPTPPLPKGDYFTHFLIKYNSIPGNETTKKEFEVNVSKDDILKDSIVLNNPGIKSEFRNISQTVEKVVASPVQTVVKINHSASKQSSYGLNGNRYINHPEIEYMPLASEYKVFDSEGNELSCLPLINKRTLIYSDGTREDYDRHDIPNKKFDNATWETIEYLLIEKTDSEYIKIVPVEEIKNPVDDVDDGRPIYYEMDPLIINLK